MSKVVALDGQPVAEPRIDLNVVEFLEERLAAAKRGEIFSVGIIWSDPSEKVFHNWAGNNRHAIAAGTIYLQHRLGEI